LKIKGGDMSTEINPEPRTSAPRSGRGGRRRTSWQKGHSGNPKGRPPDGFAWRKLIAELAQQPLPEQYRKLGATWAEVLVKKAFNLALEGNVAALREIMQRSDAAPAPETDPTQVRREVEVEVQSAKLDEERQLREALQNDPASLQELIDLQTARLDIERRMQSLAEKYLGDVDAEPRGDQFA
jgi:hypothetical protein